MEGTILNELRFSNYKRFSSAESIEIKPVTILVGKNSSGKSSITKLLPVLEKSLERKKIEAPLLYSNGYVSIGDAFPQIAHNGSAFDLSFGFTFENGISIDIVFIADRYQDVAILTYTINNGDTSHTLKLDIEARGYVCIETGKRYDADGFLGILHQEFLDDLGISCDFAQKIDYIGPFRITPDRYLSFKVGEVLDAVGPDGARAYSMLYKDSQLVAEVSSWFEKCFDGCKLQIKNDTEKNYFQILLSKPDNKGFGVNIVDEGQGMSQVLPIIVRCMKQIRNSIVIIEEPELHLHPAAHDKVAKLFATSSKENMQRYVVETHSENIILGIRDAIVDENIDFSSDDAVIYFVDSDEDGAFLQKITIDENGMLSSWPEGVFNESYELLNSILTKASKKESI